MSSTTNQAFKSAWEMHLGNISGAREALAGLRAEEIAPYADHGQLAPLLVPPRDVTPPLAHWELTQGGPVARYCYTSMAMMDLTALTEDRIDLQTASNVLFSGDIYLRKQVHSHLLFEQRFGREGGMATSMAHILKPALAFILGCDEKARELLRLLDVEIRLGQVPTAKHLPLFRFILELLYEHYDLPPLDIELAEAERLSAVDELFELRFVAEPQELIEPCLKTCDLHLGRVKADRNGFREYANSDLSLTPMEVMTLFRVRTLRGLENPSIDHPMFEVGLGRLITGPAETWPEPEPMIVRYYEQLQRDGLDPRVVDEMIRAAGF